MNIINQPEIIDKKSHIIIQNALSQQFCELLANYVNFKATIQKITTEGVLAGVHREYGDPLMEMILSELTPLIEKATQRQLWPTLSFYYMYTHGQKLLKHHDRSSCEYVVCLSIGSDEDYLEKNGTWPLIVELNGKPEPMALKFGDLLIFKGSVTEHWREQFTGKWFASAIFGFVDKNGPFAFQKYDQRKTLGKPHIGMFNWLFGCMKNDCKQKLAKLFGKK